MMKQSRTYAILKASFVHTGTNIKKGTVTEMEEKLLEDAKKIKLLDMPLESTDLITGCRPCIAKKRKISIYLILTVSAVVFAFGFSAFDFGITAIEDNNNDFFAAHAIKSVLRGEHETDKPTIAENTAKSVLGIPETSEKEDTETVLSAVTDEPPTEITTDSENDENNAPDTEKTDDNTAKYPIISMNLCEGTSQNTYFTNETGYKPDAEYLLKKENVTPSDEGAIKAGLPLVLIIHTHGTEAYSSDGAEFYSDDGNDLQRTTDTEKNVVAVGDVITQALEKSGIKTIHCKIMHDEKSYQDSYSKAAGTIKEYIAEYPSIKYVFDVHRDAILRSDGALVKAVTKIDGEDTAQIMAVVGSNYKGADFPNWENHLSFALQLRKKLNSEHGDFCRPVYLRGAAYNEQYTPGSLLLEIGSSGNTLTEAKRAAKIVGEALADMILSGAE